MTLVSGWSSVCLAFDEQDVVLIVAFVVSGLGSFALAKHTMASTLFLAPLFLFSQLCISGCSN